MTDILLILIFLFIFYRGDLKVTIFGKFYVKDVQSFKVRRR